MTTARQQTLGHRLAEKLYPSKPRRRRASPDAPRPRPKRSRSTRRNDGYAAEARRVIAAAKVAYAEHQLEASPIGRHMLQLTDARSKARFREQFAALALTTARQDADRCRAEHSRVCGQLRYGEFDAVWAKLRTAEALERKAARIHAAARESRERIDCELRTLARAAKQAR